MDTVVVFINKALTIAAVVDPENVAPLRRFLSWRRRTGDRCSSVRHYVVENTRAQIGVP